ncbi:hypothetical protein [Rhodopseudomonas sp. AAP120]|uniref:hypothetical protein n=1 Tax=Rhodopseudomonas sp. AAP120 TaxID=1523430 RepID=UPI0012E245DF|nr:hypothetical protein [Rhodopseudomonas sp. AAP120]
MSSFVCRLNYREGVHLNFRVVAKRPLKRALFEDRRALLSVDIKCAVRLPDEFVHFHDCFVHLREGAGIGRDARCELPFFEHDWIPTTG